MSHHVIIFGVFGDSLKGKQTDGVSVLCMFPVSWTAWHAHNPAKPHNHLLLQHSPEVYYWNNNHLLRFRIQQPQVFSRHFNSMITKHKTLNTSHNVGLTLIGTQLHTRQCSTFITCCFMSPIKKTSGSCRDGVVHRWNQTAGFPVWHIYLLLKFP